MNELFTGMADDDSDNEEFHNEADAQKKRKAKAKKLEQQVDYQEKHSDDDSLEENINVENEQLNTFGQQIKSALETPEERLLQKNKELQSNINQSKEELNPGENINTNNNAKIDTTMDVISHSINVMIMKEAKMNDQKLNVVDLFKTIRNAFKEVEKNMLMNMLKDKINKFFIMERQGRFQFLQLKDEFKKNTDGFIINTNMGK